jgi:hypothetical protein
MARYSVGTLQAVVLVGGAVVLSALGFCAGIVVAGGGPSGGTLGGEVAAAEAAWQGQGAARVVEPRGAAAPGAAPEAAETEVALGGGPRRKGYAERTYDDFIYKQSTGVADSAGDAVVDTAGGVVGPALDGATSAVSGALPPFMAKYVPWVTSYAAFQVRSQAKEAVEETVQGQIIESGDAVKRVAGGEAAPRPGAAGAAAQPSAQPSAGPARPPAGTTTAAAAGAPAAPRQVVPPTPGGTGAVRGVAWTIEMGRFATARSAEGFAGQIGQRGVDVRVSLDMGADGRAWHTVQSGRYASEAEANRALDRLRGRGFGGTVVTQSSGSNS